MFAEVGGDISYVARWVNGRIWGARAKNDIDAFGDAEFDRDRSIVKTAFYAVADKAHSRARCRAPTLNRSVDRSARIAKSEVGRGVVSQSERPSISVSPRAVGPVLPNFALCGGSGSDSFQKGARLAAPDTE